MNILYSMLLIWLIYYFKVVDVRLRGFVFADEVTGMENIKKRL